MARIKKLRQKGKLRFSKYFQEFNKGERVAIQKELSIPDNFPRRIEGRVGEVKEKRGNSYVIKINDFRKNKSFIIHPIHLEKIKSNQARR